MLELSAASHTVWHVPFINFFLFTFLRYMIFQLIFASYVSSVLTSCLHWMFKVQWWSIRCWYLVISMWTLQILILQLNPSLKMLIKIWIVAHFLKVINQGLLTLLAEISYVQTGRFRDTYWSRLIWLRSNWIIVFKYLCFWKLKS